jgi:hypothetical protein
LLFFISLVPAALFGDTNGQQQQMPGESPLFLLLIVV